MKEIRIKTFFTESLIIYEDTSGGSDKLVRNRIGMCLTYLKNFY